MRDAVAALTSTAPVWARYEAALLRELGKGPEAKNGPRGLVRHVTPPVIHEARRTRAASAAAAEDENDHGDGAAPHAPRSAPSGRSGAPPTGAFRLRGGGRFNSAPAAQLGARAVNEPPPTTQTPSFCSLIRVTF